MATQTPVQHAVYSSNSNLETGNTFKYQLENATGANNAQLFATSFPSTATLSSIKGYNAAGALVDTWSTTPIATVTDSSNSVKFAVFGLFGGAGGVVTIILVFSAAQYGVTAAYSEWYNVATAAATDGSNSNVNALTASGQSITSGSITTTTAGDLILQFGQSTDWGTAAFDGYNNGFSKWTAGSGYKFLQADLIQGYFCQYSIQASAGAVNPSASVTQTQAAYTVCSITIALKAASAGTPPSATAVRVFGIYHYRLTGTGATGNKAYPVQFPTTGNAFVANASDPINQIALVSISGTASGSWTTISSSGGDAQGCYKVSGTASSNEMLTFTLNDVVDHQFIQGTLRDIVNAGAFDTSQHFDSGTTFGPGNSTPTYTFTPGVSSGLVIAVIGILTGPPDSLVSPAGRFLSVYYTGETDPSLMDDGDFFATYAFSSNAAQTWQFHNTASTSGFSALLISIAQAASAAQSLVAAGATQRFQTFLAR